VSVAGRVSAGAKPGVATAAAPAAASGAAATLEPPKEQAAAPSGRFDFTRTRVSPGTPFQAKPRVSMPGDFHEQEADRVADLVMSSSQPPPAAPLAVSPRAAGLAQRACATCSTQPGKCSACEEEELQRKANDGALRGEEHDEPLPRFASGGQPLDATTRSFFESRFAHSFAHVRVHADQAASDAAGAVHARAFTTGHNIVFNRGEYAPSSTSGRWLLAHELTHVLQQRGGAPAAGVQRKEESAAALAPSTAPSGLIVEDDAPVRTGTMRKTPFIALLEQTIRSALRQGLMGSPYSERDCPWIDYWLDHFRQQPAAYGERVIHKYTAGIAAVGDARDYLPVIEARVLRGVARWVKTGRVSEVPEGAPAPAWRKGGAVMRKAQHGEGAVSAQAWQVRGRLGGGQPIEGGLRARMESAFSEDFSGVRVHTDPAAAALSSELDARAFTVGTDVAFAAGEYRPGTPIGDALIAHELAHVAQQRGAGDGAEVGAEPASSSLEEDADVAAVGAVASLWGKATGALARFARKATRRLRSGLRLQRCSTGTCPDGYCWTVTSRTGGLGGCVCTWECRKLPAMSGTSMISDPYKVDPLFEILPDSINGVGAMGTQGTIASPYCMCITPDRAKGNVCQDMGGAPELDVNVVGKLPGGEPVAGGGVTKTQGLGEPPGGMVEPPKTGAEPPKTGAEPPKTFEPPKTVEPPKTGGEPPKTVEPPKTGTEPPKTAEPPKTTTETPKTPEVKKDTETKGEEKEGSTAKPPAPTGTAPTRAATAEEVIFFSNHGFTYDPSTGVATKGGVTAKLDASGRWVYSKGSNAVATEYMVMDYKDAPGTKGFFNAHHPAQDAWAEGRLGNLPDSVLKDPKLKYRQGDEPCILLRNTYKDSPHQRITVRQGKRAETIGTRTYAQERAEVVNDLTAAGVPAEYQKQVLDQADAYFAKLRNNITDPAVRDSIFGDWGK
jgi:hypothetical protein